MNLCLINLLFIKNEQKDNDEKKENNLEKDFFGDDDFDAEL